MLKLDYNQYKNLILSRLAKLSVPKQVAFCCCCCQRLEPCYRAYMMVTTKGCDPGLIHDILNNLWAALPHGRFDLEVIADDLVRWQRINVDEEKDPEHVLDGPYTYGTWMVESTLKFVQDQKPERLGECISFSSSAVGEYLAATTMAQPGVVIEDQQLLEMVGSPLNIPPDNLDIRKVYRWEHPLAVEERNKQQRDLDILEAAKGLTPKLLSLLRKSCKEYGIRPFTRGIVLGGTE